MNKTFRSNSSKIRTVDICDSFPNYEDATELFEQLGCGKSALCFFPARAARRRPSDPEPA